MHIKIDELENGSWVMVSNRAAQYMATAGLPQALVNVKFFGQEHSAKHFAADLRPIYLNRQVIEQCGFKQVVETDHSQPNSIVYRDAFFHITVGGAETNYLIKGYAYSNPGFSYLLSQLHIFQKIYKRATAHSLIFLPR